MKNNIVLPFLVVFILSWLFSFWGVWWLFTIPSFFGGLFFYSNARNAFFTGFISITFLWLLFGTIAIMKDENNFVQQVLHVFTMDTPLKNAPNLLVLFLIYSVIAGILGALASLTGFQIKKIIW